MRKALDRVTSMCRYLRRVIIYVHVPGDTHVNIYVRINEYSHLPEDNSLPRFMPHVHYKQSPVRRESQTRPEAEELFVCTATCTPRVTRVAHRTLRAEPMASQTSLSGQVITLGKFSSGTGGA